MGQDGSFDITMEHLADYPFSVFGQGNSVEEAKEDFFNTYEEMKELMNDKGVVFEELDFEFIFDTSAFLLSLSNSFSMAGLSKITGINRKQLGHYVQGVKKPRPATASRIQRSVLDYAKNIASVRFV